jgi:hypothetical protein
MNAQQPFIPSQSYLKECFEYLPDTGELIWKERPLSHFKCKQSWLAWNTKYAGRAAGVIDKSNGYRRIQFSGSLLGASRIIWKWMTGEDPVRDIDHINLNKDDNRWRNLRQATVSQNNANKRCPKTNKLGVKGVNWHKRSRKFRAEIRVKGVLKHLGLFDTIEAAKEAYDAEAIRVFGEFARLA